MDIICVNPKNYKLTLNKEYFVIEESNDYYIIVNDGGVISKYGKTLFEIVGNNVPEAMNLQGAEPQVEQVAPQPVFVRMTEQEMMDRFTIETSYNEQENRLEYKIYVYYLKERDTNDTVTDNPLVLSVNYNLSRRAESPISCGITEYNVIGSFLERICDQFVGNEVLDDDYNELLHAIVFKMFDILFSDRDGAFHMISLVVDDIPEELHSLANYFDAQSDIVTNSNSGNDIVIYIKNDR